MSDRRFSRSCVSKAGCVIEEFLSSSENPKVLILDRLGGKSAARRVIYNNSMVRKLSPYVLDGIAVAIAYMGFDWAVGAAIHSRKVVLVPDISSKSVNDALNILSPLGLGLQKD